MTPPGIFKRRKKETEEKIEKEKTLLEDLCKGDNKLYNALSRTLLLNPELTKRAGEIDARVEKAQEYEKNKDYVRARVEYQTAGELALYDGKPDEAQELFKKAAEIDPTSPNRSIFEFLAKKENAQRATTVALEYYALKAKPTESE